MFRRVVEKGPIHESRHEKKDENEPKVPVQGERNGASRRGEAIVKTQQDDEVFKVTGQLRVKANHKGDEEEKAEKALHAL